MLIVVMKLSEQQLRDGARAKQLLDDPMLANAFEDVRLTIISGIATSSFEDAEQRESGYFMLRALESVKGQLERHIRTAAGIQAEEKDTELRTVLRPVELAKEED